MSPAQAADRPPMTMTEILRWFRDGRGISRVAATVGTALVSHFRYEKNDDGVYVWRWCHLTNKELAAKARYSLRHTQRGLAELVGLGLIRRIERHWQCNVYELNVANLQKLGEYGAMFFKRVKEKMRRLLTKVHPDAPELEEDQEPDYGRSPGHIVVRELGRWATLLGMDVAAGQRRWNAMGSPELSVWRADCRLVAEALDDCSAPLYRKLRSGKADIRRGRVWIRAVGTARDWAAGKDKQPEQERRRYASKVGAAPVTEAPAVAIAQLMAAVKDRDARAAEVWFNPERIEWKGVRDGALVLEAENEWVAERIADWLFELRLPFHVLVEGGFDPSDADDV